MQFIKQFTAIERKVLFLIITLSILGAYCSDSYLPSLPAISHSLNTSYSAAKWSISLYLMGFGLSQLFYGPLSDRYGRRPIILIGLFIGLTGSIIACSAQTIFFLLLGRLIQGTGLGVSNTLFRALFRDSFTGTQAAKVMALAGMLYSLAIATGPALGGYIQTYFGWRANLLAQVILLIFSFSVNYFYLEETLKIKNHKLSLKETYLHYIQVLRCKTFFIYTLASTLAFSGMVTYLTMAPFLYQVTLKLDAHYSGWIMASTPIMLLIGQYTNRIVLDYIVSKKMVLIGTIICILSGVLLVFAALLGQVNVSCILIPMLIYTFGSAFIYPTASTEALQPFADKAGIASGLYGFSQISICFLATGFAAHLNETTQFPLGIILIIFSLISFISLKLFMK